MWDGEQILSGFLLFIAGAIGSYFIFKLYEKERTLLSFRVAIIAVYVLVNPLSGIVHLFYSGFGGRGYFDLLQVSDSSYFSVHFIAILGTILGALALGFGCLGPYEPEKWRGRDDTRNLAGRRSRAILLIFSAFLFPISIFSLIQVQSYLSMSEAARRVIALSDGMAKFGFMANWIAWAVSFLSLWLSLTWFGKSRFRCALILLAAVFLIATSFSWTGGRSVAILMSLPLLISLYPRLGRSRNWVMGIFVLANLVYAVFITEYRKQDDYVTEFSLLSALDWEFGRYSMLGFAIDYTSKSGFTFGETLYGGLFSVPYAIIKLFGFSDGLWIPRMVTEITGQSILGDKGQTYIVPGMSAELYINFGILGIVVGYFILGRAIRFVDRLCGSQLGQVEKFPVIYLGVILIFCTVSAQSGAFFGYLFFSGFPVVALWMYTRLRRV